MINRATLTALFKNFLAGVCFYAIGMSFAHASNYNQIYDWCDPTYCCNPTKVT